MVKQSKPIDRHVDKIFIEARRFTPVPLANFKFADLTATEKDTHPFTNHDLDNIAMQHRNIRKQFWMYNADGTLNMEGARVLFRRKEGDRQYFNDPSTLNDNVDNGGRMARAKKANQLADKRVSQAIQRATTAETRAIEAGNQTAEAENQTTETLNTEAEMPPKAPRNLPQDSSPLGQEGLVPEDLTSTPLEAIAHAHAGSSAMSRGGSLSKKIASKSGALEDLYEDLDEDEKPTMHKELGSFVMSHVKKSMRKLVNTLQQ
ncbi:hypothetical protein N7486_005450 [Penicillium sp. IBT 16267x]|nr:hypothetical protein N7486_005450 [Penicillium sp. IBT 16267x]